MLIDVFAQASSFSFVLTLFSLQTEAVVLDSSKLDTSSLMYCFLSKIIGYESCGFCLHFQPVVNFEWAITITMCVSAIVISLELQR